MKSPGSWQPSLVSGTPTSSFHCEKETNSEIRKSWSRTMNQLFGVTNWEHGLFQQRGYSWCSSIISVRSKFPDWKSNSGLEAAYSLIPIFQGWAEVHLGGWRDTSRPLAFRRFGLHSIFRRAWKKPLATSRSRIEYHNSDYPSLVSQITKAARKIQGNAEGKLRPATWDKTTWYTSRGQSYLPERLARIQGIFHWTIYDSVGG